MTAIGSTFDTQEPFLRELLDRVHKGQVQLPDFQRGWVWDDDRIRALIASISLSYPIGAVMFTETGGEGARFSPRLVEGVKEAWANAGHAPPKASPEQLILDGQQRITSLYQALRSSAPVLTRTEKREELRRYYYFDMEKCLNPDVDRVEAVVGVPEDRVVRSDFNRKTELDLSDATKEYGSHHFPLSLIFDDAAVITWQMGYQEHHGYAKERMRFLNSFLTEVRQRFLQYKVPVIELLKDTPKEAVCQVFENVNTGGVALTVFELLTATFAADNYRLRVDWEGRSKKLGAFEVLQGVSETDFIQAVTLLSTYRRHQKGQGAVGGKRKDMLRLTLQEYQACADDVLKGFEEAARLLLREKVFTARNLPYQSQLIPLAAIFAILGPEAERDEVKRKLARWYWCGVFGELYGGATDARFALDVQQVPTWALGGPEPRTLEDASFSPTRLLTLQTRQSAAYKGFMARLMTMGSEDLRTGDPIELTTYMDDSVDIHHLFPQAYCEDMKYPKKFWNSIVNKAPLTAKTNRSIGRKAPSIYLASFESTLGAERLEQILRSHAIDAATMRSDAFPAFILARAASLLDLVERATGKTVTGRDSEEVVTAFGGALVKRAA